MIEVLVVMLVLSFGVLAFLQASLVSMRVHRRSRAVSAGVLLAQEGLERIGALGWDRATAGCTPAVVPDLVGDPEPHPQETVRRSGLRFLRVYTREGPVPTPSRCTVHCFWADQDRAFEARNVVRLAALER